MNQEVQCHMIMHVKTNRHVRDNVRPTDTQTCSPQSGPQAIPLFAAGDAADNIYLVCVRMSSANNCSGAHTCMLVQISTCCKAEERVDDGQTQHLALLGDASASHCRIGKVIFKAKPLQIQPSAVIAGSGQHPVYQHQRADHYATGDQISYSSKGIIPTAQLLNLGE